MKEFTVTIDYANYYSDYKELIAYIKSIDGIKDINITENNIITVNVKYDENLINDKMIFLELEAFLKLQKYPSIYGFDRHSKEKLVCNKQKANICCECCFGNIIYTLYEKNGIEKVDSDFYDICIDKGVMDGEYTINIYYNPKIISEIEYQELIKEIECYF